MIKKETKTEKEIRKLKRNNLILILSFSFVTTLLIGFIFIFSSLIFVTEKETKFAFDNLTDKEEAIAFKLLSQVKPEYLNVQKSITFTHNLSKYYKSIRGTNRDTLLGFNEFQGRIYVRYTDPATMKDTLCHEILHTFMQGVGKNTHTVIIDLENNYRPCYKNQRSSINLH